MEVTGKILRIGKVVQVTDSFKKLDLVLEIDGDTNYPQNILFESHQDNADKVLQYNKVGQEVTVSFNLRGRDWTNKEGVVKTFNTLQAWKVFKVEGSAVDTYQNKTTEASTEYSIERPDSLKADPEDLPF